MRVSIRIKSRVFNEAYKPFLTNRTRYEIFYGGAGSGKSVFVAQRLLVRTMNERGHKFLVVRKVARTNRHSTFALLNEIIGQWGVEKLFRINKSDMEIFCMSGNQIIFTGLDDVEKLKSIAGITDIWIEEASEISQEDFIQLDLRLRGKTRWPRQISMTFNPVSALLWQKAYFFDRPREDCRMLRTTYRDNRFLDEQYKKVIDNLRNEDETYYKVYGLGEWGVLENLIYSNYTVESNMPLSFDEIIWGLDFGFNNPTALVKIGLKDGAAYVLEEFYRSGLTNNDLIGIMKERVARNESVYADSAEPNRIEEISRAGFRIYPSDKSVRDGIDYVKRQRLRICADCTYVIKEIQGYKWKRDKDGNVIDEPIKFADHAMDAIRYALYSSGQRVTISSGRIDL